MALWDNCFGCGWYLRVAGLSQGRPVCAGCREHAHMLAASRDGIASVSVAQ